VLQCQNFKTFFYLNNVEVKITSPWTIFFPTHLWSPSFIWVLRMIYWVVTIPIVDVWICDPGTNEWLVFACAGTQMVMQEEHKGFILIQANDALRPVWGCSLVLSCTRGAFVRVTSELRERESVLGLGSRGGWVLVWVLRLLNRVSGRGSTFPFIVSRRGSVYIIV
jgi:hypothetical protein